MTLLDFTCSLMHIWHTDITTNVTTMRVMKVISMGDQRTGKSCLIKRFCENKVWTFAIPLFRLCHTRITSMEAGMGCVPSS